MKILPTTKRLAHNTGAVILNPLIALLRAAATVLMLLTAWLPLLLEQLVGKCTKWLELTSKLWK